MPTLNWMGKEKVVNHHRDVPYRVLERVPEKGVLDSHGSDCGNMIIHGDNLEALKALLPEYEGKVDCIYIDPPYNTGEEKWVYNDNVNDPRIKKWLGQVVGKEGEDFSRHDKWLCMMYPRLQLLKKLLSPTGLIFISIDDNEQSGLKYICDEIFGVNNFQGCIHWRRRHNQPNDKTKLLGLVAEYILCYSQSSDSLKQLMRAESYGKIGVTGKFSNPDDDPRGPWASKPWKAARGQGGTAYNITAPNGTVFNEVWLGDRETYCSLLADNRIYFPQSRDGGLGTPRKKYYMSERVDEGQCATNWWPHDVAGCNQNATDELAALFPEIDGKVFDNPKPVKLIMRIIGMATHRDSIVLDAFAGSGTTGEAVLRRNQSDAGCRKFILIEMGDYSDNITAQRIRTVITGHTATGKTKERLYEKKLTASNLSKASVYFEEALDVKNSNIGASFDLVRGPEMDGSSIVVDGIVEKDSEIPGIDSGFSYYELGPALFRSDGMLSSDVTREDLARYVWATETRAPYEDLTDEHRYLLGEHTGAVYYLVWEPEEETTLTYDLLRGLPRKGSPTVIYADRCAIAPDRLDEMRVVFKRVPDQIARI